MLALARSRRYCFQSIGALGVIEMTAPTRAWFRQFRAEAPAHPHQKAPLFHLACCARRQAFGMLEPRGFAFARGRDPRRAHAIGEGAVLRLWHGARCFDRYRGISASIAQQSEAA